MRPSVKIGEYETVEPVKGAWITVSAPYGPEPVYMTTWST